MLRKDKTDPCDYSMQRHRNLDAYEFPTLLGSWKRKRRAIVVVVLCLGAVGVLLLL